MFQGKKKKKENRVLSPMSGMVIPLSEVPDEAFSEKLLGDGAAILPENGDVYSPVDGFIEDITDTKHAFCFAADDGTEVLLHIGVNTVNLRGEGFTVLVASGDHVEAGEKIAQVDLALLAEHSLPKETPVLLTQREKTEIVNVNTGSLRGGSDVLFTYKTN